MRRRFSREEILAFLRQAAAGTPVIDLCWNHCISRSTFRAWKARYAQPSAEGDRLAGLRRENRRLRYQLERLRRQETSRSAVDA